MTRAEIWLAIVLGLLVNECCELSPWIAVRLVRWAARLRYPDRERAVIRGEELAALVNDHPGKLFKLFTALWFAGHALMAAALRTTAVRLGTAWLGPYGWGDPVSGLMGGLTLGIWVGINVAVGFTAAVLVGTLVGVAFGIATAAVTGLRVGIGVGFQVGVLVGAGLGAVSVVEFGLVVGAGLGAALLVGLLVGLGAGIGLGVVVGVRCLYGTLEQSEDA